MDVYDIELATLPIVEHKSEQGRYIKKIPICFGSKGESIFVAHEQSFVTRYNFGGENKLQEGLVELQKLVNMTEKDLNKRKTIN